MYDNQYDAKLYYTIKTQNRLFAYEFLYHIVHYCKSNKNLLSANFQSELTSARIDKFSTKMC